jgi:hypothetical protein
MKYLIKQGLCEINMVFAEGTMQFMFHPVLPEIAGKMPEIGGHDTQAYQV